MARIARVPLARLTLQPLQRIEINGHGALLVVRRGERYFVLADNCSHGAASLADGELIGDEILCPHHRGAFDIRSGAPTRAPCALAIAAYGVSVEDGMLCIDQD